MKDLHVCRGKGQQMRSRAEQAGKTDLGGGGLSISWQVPELSFCAHSDRG